MMRMQPPRADTMKNYYSLNPKSNGKLKKYQEPAKKQFGAKVKPYKKALTTVEPRVMDGFYERSDQTIVFADEKDDVYISARPVRGPRSRSRNGDLRQEDLNTGEYLPDTDFFVIDAKDFGNSKKKPADLRVPRTDATDAEVIGQRRHDHLGRLNARIAGNWDGTNHYTNANHVHNNKRNAAQTNNGERMEFQMHGFNGPDSYKFGYDTGKG